MNFTPITIKYLLLAFNLVFSLCGLTVLICGVLALVNLKHLTFEIPATFLILSIAIIVTGGITFVIGLFGGFNTIRKDRRMFITFGIIIPIIFFVQIILSIYFYFAFFPIWFTEVEKMYTEKFNEYYDNFYIQGWIDSIQQNMHCCGVKGEDDFLMISNATEKYPRSCCIRPKNGTCESFEMRYYRGCIYKVFDVLLSGREVLRDIIYWITVVQLIEVIFALFLARIIRNQKRTALEA
ncbi:hypothetical protein PV327_010220 [Microctonus hyperodae]|uniref:Tetraspanin n=1 Tax=Microctonus hyperodae TaxID=165561 RepID=A0AA39FRP6_MICHY|nr:hypothetical protein PV327_010220 [Microctonus hyperodae]